MITIVLVKKLNAWKLHVCLSNENFLCHVWEVFYQLLKHYSIKQDSFCIICTATIAIIFIVIINILFLFIYYFVISSNIVCWGYLNNAFYFRSLLGLQKLLLFLYFSDKPKICIVNNSFTNASYCFVCDKAICERETLLVCKKSQNIVDLLDFYTDNLKYYFVFELLEGGDLLDNISVGLLILSPAL